MCDRDMIQFVMFTVWMFTFVDASCGNLYDSTAFLFVVVTGIQVNSCSHFTCSLVKQLSYLASPQPTSLELTSFHLN